QLSGVSQEVELSVRADRAVVARLTGALLWTHFGVSGPVAMNASRHWLRARLESRNASITVNLRPGQRFEDVDAEWQRRASLNPRSSVQSTLAAMVPVSVAAAMLQHLGIDGGVGLAHFGRDDRRR